MARRDPVVRALEAQRQSKHVVFRAAIDPTSDAQWCELVRDLVALANTDGGVLVLGVDRHGMPVGLDPAAFHALSRASVTERVRSHTGYDLPELSVRRLEKGGRALLAFIVERTHAPIPISKAGAAADGRASQLVAGAVYVRRGGRSVPATRSDMSAMIERRLDDERAAWRHRLLEMTRVPARLHVTETIGDVKQVTDPSAPAIRIVDQPDAPAYRMENPDAVYPYRQKELIARLRELLGELLPEGTAVSAHTILSINWAHGTRERPEWTYHPKFGSVQYNEAFAQWIVDQVRKDPAFLEKAHRHWYVVRYGRPPS
jgi:hypothetical protein